MNTQIDVIPEFNFWSLLLLICSGQAFFFAIVFMFHKKGNKIANKFLSVLTLMFSLYFLFISFYWSRHLVVFPNLMGIMGLVNFMWGPLYYLYVSEQFEKNRSFNYKKLLHFIPAFISIIYTSRIYFIDIKQRVNYIKNLVADETYYVSLSSLIFGGVVISHIFIYTFLSVRKLNVYSHKNNSNQNSLGYIKYKWLQKLSYGFVGFFFSWFLYEVVMFFGVEYARSVDYAICVFGVAIFMMIAIYSLRQPEIISGASSIKDDPKYEKSKIGFEDAQLYLNKLENLMTDEKVYLDNELNIRTLSEKIEITPHRLSQVINEFKQMNFSDYLNYYRVEEAKSRLIDPRFTNQTILSIAFDVGFNNKVTFNNSFKKLTGVTPSEFRSTESATIAAKN